MLAGMSQFSESSCEPQAPQPAHASYVFLLDDEGGVHALPHAVYVALARHGACSPDFAGQRLRLADWYVRLHDGAPAAIVNETYALARFDAQGRLALEAAPGDAGWPTFEERARMEAMLFASAQG